MLLQQLYPESEQQWVARHRGTFYRNYSADAMAVYEQEKTVELSRDGMLTLLPKEMLSPSWELAEKDLNGKRYTKDRATRLSEMNDRLHVLSEAFLPLDSFHFRTRIAVERHVEELLEMKLAYILRNYFDFDLAEPHDELVLEAAMLLPFVAKVRGNKDMIASLLTVITGYKTRVRQSAYSHKDNSKAWMPRLHYDVMIPNLTSERYKEQSLRLQPLIDFVKEHLVPFDTFCDIEIKSAPSMATKNLLNYNTYVQ